MEKRSKISEKYKWNLKTIYKSESEFFSELNNLNFDNVNNLKNKKLEKNNILKLLDLYFDTYRQIAKLYTYANLKLSEDVSNSNAIKNKMLAEEKYTNFLNEFSFVEPSLLSLEEDFLKSLINDKKFTNYDVYLKNLLRQKSHILSEKEEKILAGTSSFSGGFDDIQSTLENADLKFNDITLESGKKIKLNGLNYTTLLSQLNKEDRKKVYNEYYRVFENHINTFAINYIFSIKKDCFYAKARNFTGCMEASLFNEEVDSIVYENLIKTINNSLPVMHKYFAIKAKETGKKKLNFYDVYLKDKKINKKVEFAEALNLVKNCTKNLGEDYTSYLVSCYKNRWIDIYPNENKRGGAFCSDVYAVSPFVLLNYNNKLDDVFTVAHELGHAMHSHYSMENLPFSKYDYTIFVAEVASTVNELLLLKYLKSNAKNKEEKKYYVKHFIESFKSTVFRQTMFSEFEKIAHELVEQNKGISKDILCDTYLNLVKKYHGNAFIYDKNIKYEWARIPHFFTPYYVYKYATGFITAVILSEKIYNNDEKTIIAYKNFLSSGGIKDPITLLKETGVDLTNLSSMNYAIKVLENSVKELTSLTK